MNAVSHASEEASLATMTPSPWFPGFSPCADGLPVLFCFSYAGGSAETFWTWQEALASAARICPVELPGRGRRYSEPFIDSVGSCVRAVARDIARIKPDASYFFGHSLGSILALETVKELIHAHEYTPRALIVSGRHAPHVKPETRNISSAADEVVTEELRRLGGTPEKLLNDPDLLDFILPIVRQDFALIERHQARLSPVVDLPVRVCCGEADPDVPLGILSRWAEVTTGECEVRTFKGGHFYIDESREALLDYIVSILRDHEARRRFA